MRSILIVLSIAAFCSGCAGIDQRLEQAAETQGQLEATRTLPDLPAQCRRLIRSGVQTGDRLDTALLKTDAALARQHELTRLCAAWYDELREGFANDETPPGPS